MVAGCAEISNEPAIYSSLAAPNVELNANEARAIINDYRRSHGLAPLQIDPDLMREADAHAHDMANRDKVGHNISRGNLATRLRSAGIQRSMAAENVGAGYHTIAQAFSGWRGSPNHDKNLRQPDARRMGIAAAYAPTSKYKVFWTLIVSSD